MLSTVKYIKTPHVSQLKHHLPLTHPPGNEIYTKAKDVNKGNEIYPKAKDVNEGNAIYPKANALKIS